MTATADNRWVEALLREESFAHPAHPIELIETHISWVVLTGEFAYKIKKPVDLGFLDFSSLEKRRLCCDAEVRLNQRLAPSIYLGVVPIVGTRDRPRVADEHLAPTGVAPEEVADSVLDYAVKMRQFAQDAQLDRMLERGALEADQLDAFARLIADFHRAAPRAGDDVPFGSPEAVFDPVRENFQHIRSSHLPGVDAAALDALEAWSLESWRSLESVFVERKRLGFVREGHGDLHLRNLAWVNDEPVAFDCIEFNANLRWIDVLCDVAFLVMDLLDREQPLLACRFLNAYLERTGDYDHLGVLPYYLSYRALVRAKVTAIRLGQADLVAAERTRVRTEFDGYVRLALSFGEAAPPLLILTCGLSGSGKTTLTTPLLERVGAIRIRSDVERKRLHGLAAEDSGRARVDGGIYDAASSRRTYQRLLDEARALLAARRSVIVDATFLTREQRAPFESLARSAGVGFVILEFLASPATLRERLVARRGDASDADVDVLEAQLERWPALTAAERKRALSIDTEQPVDADELAARVLAYRQA